MQFKVATICTAVWLRKYGLQHNLKLVAAECGCLQLCVVAYVVATQLEVATECAQLRDLCNCVLLHTSFACGCNQVAYQHVCNFVLLHISFACGCNQVAYQRVCNSVWLRKWLQRNLKLQLLQMCVVACNCVLLHISFACGCNQVAYQRVCNSVWLRKWLQRNFEVATECAQLRDLCNCVLLRKWLQRNLNLQLCEVACVATTHHLRVVATKLHISMLRMVATVYGCNTHIIFATVCCCTYHLRAVATKLHISVFATLVWLRMWLQRNLKLQLSVHSCVIFCN
ncbi:hypothetical protein BC829DRAFT_422793 [Chytridium lagenaria]|nr:hypothetical protein BC829DRAFT_422793 [Chytridium lagenaria]